MKRATYWKFPLLIAAVAGLILAGIAALADPAAAGADTGQPPAPPASVTLTTEPTSTKVTASWPTVDSATSYKVQWRQRRNVYHLASQLTVTGATATFDTVLQGAWVVRVAACNAAGCSRGATASATVVINTHRHPAVRVWRNGDNYELEWDPLPGYFVLSYQSPGDDEFTTSAPTTQNRHSIPASTFTGFPIIRVQFNCNELGRNCAALGRFPYNFLPPAPPAPGDASAFLGPNVRLEEECIDRPARNDWERWFQGDTVRECNSPVVAASSAQSADGPAVSGEQDPFTCITCPRNKASTTIVPPETIVLWMSIYFCYEPHSIKNHRLSGAGVNMPPGARAYPFIATEHCGWVHRQSPDHPYTDIQTGRPPETGRTVVTRFSVWVQARFKTAASATMISFPVCADPTAKVDYLPARQWVGAGGAAGLWGSDG